ncbi:MAG: aldo/keto reductase [Mesorhizobium sp.]|nr:aldo/keto reductase [Mesorhizobium sp.]
MKETLFRAPSGAVLGFTELGFGTAPLGNLYRAMSDETADATLRAAWDAGIRYFDTAPLYGLGLAETRLNRFLRDKPRDAYLLSTKIGRLLRVAMPDQRTGIGKFFDVPNRREVYAYSHDGVMRSMEASLERLGVDRIDILLAHDLDIFTHGSKAAADARVAEFFDAGGYRAMARLRDEGVVKAIGAGVNEWQVCQTLAGQGDFDLFLLAGRYTLLEQESLESFLPLCARRGIGIVIGGAYNSGILASGPKPGAFYNYEPAPPAILERVAAIQAVCARHGVALAQAALRFPLAHPAVVCVIPGAAKPDEVALNIATLGVDIPAALWTDLKGAGLIRADAPEPKGTM